MSVTGKQRGDASSTIRLLKSEQVLYEEGLASPPAKGPPQAPAEPLKAPARCSRGGQPGASDRGVQNPQSSPPPRGAVLQGRPPPPSSDIPHFFSVPGSFLVTFLSSGSHTSHSIGIFSYQLIFHFPCLPAPFLCPPMDANPPQLNVFGHIHACGSSWAKD